MRSVRFLLLLGFCGVAIFGCGRGDSDGFTQSNDAGSVDFLMFPNPQASLGAVDYDIVITNGSGSSFTYTLTIAQTDGTTDTATGTLANAASTTVNYTQKYAGGVTITLNSGGGSATLRLCVHNTTCTGASLNLANTTGANPSITLPRHQIDQAAYTVAYYAAIDPLNDRDTLTKFKTTNGFGSSCSPNGTSEFEVKFRDVRDLGYGRHLCVRGDASTVVNGTTVFSTQVAAWVENFQVTAVPSQHYERLNLEAVIADDRRWHVGTNAIEYGPADPTALVSLANPRIVKFYTFNPDGTRRTLVDLDGRGAKAMPIPCISCHGGHALPLTAAGLFPRIRTAPRGETFARMQPLNVDTLDFSDASPYRRTDQEATFRNINKLVLCTFPLVGAAGAGGEDDCRAASVNSEWGGSAAAMVKSWYGGTGANGLPNATASDTYVPTEWQDAQTDGTVFPNVAVPTGATSLYQSVVAPNCRVCHLLRGNQNEHGINFAGYGKFGDATASHIDPPSVGSTAHSYNHSIKHHVFDKGNMPLALLKWELFWESTAPAALATWITGAISGGSVLLPTRPVAIPGPNRTIVTNVAVKLSAAESVNATSYAWSVTSGNFANTTLTNANTIRPTFTATANGVYTVQLIVSNGTTDSAPATFTIGAVASLTDGASVVTVADPGNIRFSHIKAILQDGTTYFCALACHYDSSGGVPNASGPPVYYTSYDRNGDGTNDSGLPNSLDDHQFYLDIRARINFTDVESSRILFRPSGHHHPGTLIVNFDTSITPGSAGRGAYDIFLNWILNGAPE